MIINARTRGLFVAILSGFVGRAITAFLPLIVMPAMLEHLGPVLFGTWLTAATLSTIATFLDFGIGNAATTRLSDAFGRDDMQSVRSILGEAYIALFVLTGTLLLFVAVGYFSIQRLNPGEFENGQVTVVAVVLSALFLSFPGGIIWRLQQSQHRFIAAQLAQMAPSLVTLCVSLWVIRVGFSPIATITVYALTNPLVLMVWSLVHFSRNATQRPDFQRIRWSSMRSLVELGGAFFVLSIFTLIGMNADNIILAAIAGSEVVAEYGVPARLGAVLMLIVGTVFMPLWPLFGAALAQNDRLWLAKTSRRMSFGGGFLILAFGLTMTAYSDFLFDIWMSRNFEDQKRILIGWTASATIIALTAPYNMILNASGMASKQLPPWIVFVSISVALKYFLLTGQTAWIAPWITTGVYAVTVLPVVAVLAMQRLKEIPLQQKSAPDFNLRKAEL